MSFSFSAVAFERGSVGFPQPPGIRGCGGWRKPGGASPSWVLGSGHRGELWSEFGRRTQINTVKPGYRKVTSCLVRAVFALCLKTCSEGGGVLVVWPISLSGATATNPLPVHQGGGFLRPRDVAGTGRGMQWRGRMGTHPDSERLTLFLW